jgi:hypothetical protein
MFSGANPGGGAPGARNPPPLDPPLKWNLKFNSKKSKIMVIGKKIDKHKPLNFVLIAY